jgi:SAM-dependent methyltransferase
MTNPSLVPGSLDDQGVSHRYVGSELELFATAKNWKTYVASILGPFIGGRVLEVGAGIGGNIGYLYNGGVSEWTSLEPDPDFVRRIDEARAAGVLPAGLRVISGTIERVADADPFDTILYIDVLEHIRDDAAELVRARQLLAVQGNLVVLAPAHQFLFSPFDDAIGHYRRYDRAQLAALTPAGSRLEACFLLDCAGFFASLANAMLLSAPLPSQRQIAVWDSILVPISRVLDRATAYKFGKTVVAIWRPSA